MINFYISNFFFFKKINQVSIQLDKWWLIMKRYKRLVLIFIISLFLLVSVAVATNVTDTTNTQKVIKESTKDNTNQVSKEKMSITKKNSQVVTNTNKTKENNKETINKNIDKNIKSSDENTEKVTITEDNYRQYFTTISGS